MIRLKTTEEINFLREGGKNLALVLLAMAEVVKPGVSSADLDKIAFSTIEKMGDKPSFLGYKGKYDKKAYPASTCVSVNDAVVHGEPTENPIVLQEGDIVSLDAGLIHKGLFTDSAITVPVGKISEDDKQLIYVTRASLEKGISVAKIGVRKFSHCQPLFQCDSHIRFRFYVYRETTISEARSLSILF